MKFEQTATAWWPEHSAAQPKVDFDPDTNKKTSSVQINWQLRVTFYPEETLNLVYLSPLTTVGGKIQKKTQKQDDQGETPQSGW